MYAIAARGAAVLFRGVDRSLDCADGLHVKSSVRRLRARAQWSSHSSARSDLPSGYRAPSSREFSAATRRPGRRGGVGEERTAEDLELAMRGCVPRDVEDPT